jgi:peptide/nickel transport system substrate-binding protein
MLAACAPAAPAAEAPAAEAPAAEAPAAEEPAAKAKVITIGVNSENPPWVFMESGKIVGFEADIAEEFGKRAGYEIDYKTAPFATVLTGVQSGQWDVAMSSIWVKAERAEVMDFAEPYYDALIGMMARTDTLKSTSDMKGKAFGADTGSANEAWLQAKLAEYGPYEIKSYDYWADAVMDLQAERIDGVVLDAPQILYYAKENPDSGVGLAFYIYDESFGQALAFEKGSPLVAEFNAVQNEMKKDGTLAAIHKKWFASDPPADSCVINECPVYMPNEKPGMEKTMEEAPMAGGLNDTKPLMVAVPVDMSSWDPDNMSTKTDAGIMEHIFDKLVNINDAGKIEPMVATEWELLEDNLTWRFKLRDDVYFWDGEQLTAETVKYVIDRALAVEEFGWTGNTPGFVFDSWKVEGAEVVDEFTVDIKLGGFSDDFLAAASEIYLHSIDYYKNNDPEVVAEVPNGSGPYKFVEWVKDGQMVLERWDDYWGEKPLLKTIIYRPIPEASTAVAEMLAGSINVVSKIPPDQTETINASGIAEVTTIDGGRRIYIGLNQRGEGGCYEAMKNLEVRKALNMAVDVQTILEALLYGKGTREGGMVNPPFKSDAVKAYEYNPEKAKEMLAAAGYPDGDLGGRCEIATPNGRYIKDYEIAQAVAAELQAIGVDAEAVPYEWSVFRPMITDKTLPPMFLLGSGGGSVSAWYDLADFGSDQTNYVGWKSAEWDALVAEFSASTDMARREELTDQMQLLVNQEAPWLFIYMQVDWYAKTNDLDWTPRKDELMMFKNSSWVQ